MPYLLFISDKNCLCHFFAACLKKLIFLFPEYKNQSFRFKLKMPGVKNTQKRTSKKAVSAKRHNDKTVASLFEGDDHYVIGRVEKNFGSGGFQVIVESGTVVGMPLGKFTRSTMPIEANSFVALEPSTTGRAKVLEIVGVLSRSDAQRLYKAKRMSKKVWSVDEDEDKDDIFDYDKVSADGDSDVDIDAV
jgi:hypothetical protein